MEEDHTMSVRPKVAVLVHPTFTQFEIAIAQVILSRSYDIVTVAPHQEMLTSEEGLQVWPHASIDQITPSDYAALVVSAAPDMQAALETPAILNLIRTMDEQGKVIGAICGAPMLLAKAGILRDRPYTVSLYRRFRDTLGFFNEATFRYEAVVESENLITAQGWAFAEFGVQLGKRLNSIRDLAAAAAYYQGQGDIYWDKENT
jgi:4-methyl-5(b-hydroxyethyl)-thiazole monophosphate biosynthesis